MDRQLVLNEGERIIGDEDDFNARMHRAVYSWACEKAAVEVRRGRSGVLDFGCGSGYGTRMLAEALPGARVFGEDVDFHAVSWAELYNNGGDFRFLRSPPFRAPLAYELHDGQIQTIVALGVLEHLPLPPKYYVMEWLKAGVTVIGSVPYREYPGVNPFHYHSRLNTDDIVPYDERGGLDCEWRGFVNEAGGEKHVELGPDAEQYPHNIVLMMFCLSPKGAGR
jgi:SAM-dependent methyltransferase